MHGRMHACRVQAGKTSACSWEACLMPCMLCGLQATHIFDGLEQWPTHIMFLTRGRLKVFKEAAGIPELAEDRLLQLVEG